MRDDMRYVVRRGRCPRQPLTRQVVQRATSKRSSSSGGSFDAEAPCVTRMTEPWPFGVSVTKYAASEREPTLSSVVLPSREACTCGKRSSRQLATDDAERADEA